MGKKKRRKALKRKFGQKKQIEVATITELGQEGSGRYAVNITQTPGAHKARTQALRELDCRSMDLTLEQAQELKKLIDELYNKDPDKVVK